MLKMKLMKVIGILGSLVMFYIDLRYILFLIRIIPEFYSATPDFLTGLVLSVTILFIPYALILLVGGVLFTLTCFFLGPAIDF